MMGQVEVDETYIGGKNRNRHGRTKPLAAAAVGKTPVIGAISRKGQHHLQSHRKYDHSNLVAIRAPGRFG